MDPHPKAFIHHFSHPGHPLKSVHANQEFLCDGCKTVGTGKRFRCNECDFDLHDYCGMCPSLLFSFMHTHPITLATQQPQKSHKIDRICDICKDPVKGLFYRCKECEFDVHPLCTQLPEKLHHALHKTHPMILQPSLIPSFCGVCRNSCNGWRYRCAICNFDIHLECILAPVVTYSQQHKHTSQREIATFGQRVDPFHPRPQFTPYYDFLSGSPGHPSFGHGYPNPGPANFNMYHGGQYMYPQQNFVPQNYQVGGAGNNDGTTTGQLGKSMFSLVGQLGFGVLSNMIFGVGIPSLFVG